MTEDEVLQALVAEARRAGADAADAMLVAGTSLSVHRRLGKLEQLERSESFDIGLRVFVGQRQAVVSTTDTDPQRYRLLAERAVAMAKAVPDDPFAGLPDAPDGLTAADFELSDDAEPDPATLIERCALAEEAALAVHGVTNSEGAEAGWSRTTIALAASNGFAGRYIRSGHSISVTALAGSGTAMERDYDYDSVLHLADLDDAASIGRRAGERAVKRLNPTRPSTAQMSVVFDPRVSASLLGHLASAINGSAVARGTTFLRDKLGQRVLAPGLTVIDDPGRRRGLLSRPFDGEGMAGTRREVVQDGVLTTWFLDTRSGRQLGLPSTGHASRGTGGVPGPAPSNIWLAAGTVRPEALMADIREGLYVTDLIGMGVNIVTGDYSRGVAGFMIRDGVMAEPVSEVTIAGRLQDMFLHMIPADDLAFRRGSDAPTIRIDGLTLAGQ